MFGDSEEACDRTGDAITFVKLGHISGKSVATVNQALRFEKTRIELHTGFINTGV